MDIDMNGKLNNWIVLNTKNYLGYFPGRLKYAELGKSTRLTFWVPMPKLLRLYIILISHYSAKPYQGLWFKWTHLPLFQNMSVTIYINFFLSSIGYNFKISYLKDKMRKGIKVHILLNNLASSPLQREYYCLEKFEFKVFPRSSN